MLSSAAETNAPQIDAFLSAWEDANGGVLRTGSYLSYVGPDGVMRNAANVAFLSRLVYDMEPVPTRQHNKCWSEFQARIILGDSKRSYVVGTKYNPPMQAQHRVSTRFVPASLRGFPLNGCTQKSLQSRNVFSSLPSTCSPVMRRS